MYTSGAATLVIWFRPSDLERATLLSFRIERYA